jgi:hypothetical protein
VETNKTSSELSGMFTYMSDHWLCEEAVALGLLYSLEANTHCDWSCAGEIVRTAIRVMRKSANQNASLRSLVSQYLVRITNHLNRLGQLAKQESIDIVFPYCGENVEWLLHGLESRKYYMEDGIKQFGRFVIIDKCPLRKKQEALTLREQLLSLFKEVVYLEAFESIIGSECTGNLEYIVDLYDKFSDYAIFIHPDLEEHVPAVDVFFDSLFFVTNGYFLTIFDSSLSFIPLGLNHLEPFWARHPKFKVFFKRFHAAVFGLSSPGLVPDPENMALYCCAHFLVKTSAIRLRARKFYVDALALLNDPQRLGSIFGYPGHALSAGDAKDRTPCEFMMAAWQLMFGEDAWMVKREESPAIPLYYKTRNMKLIAGL